MKRWQCTLAAVFFLSPAFAQESTETRAQEPATTSEVVAAPAAPALPLGAWVQLELVDPLSSRTATTGQPVALRLAEPISVDGAVVVPAGATARGEIIDVQQHGMVGRPGLLIAASRSLEFEGTEIPLEGMIVGASGRNRASDVAIGVALVGPLAVFVQGEPFEVAAGSRVQARLAGGPPEVSPAVEGVNQAPAPPPGKAIVVFFRPRQNSGWPYTYGVAEGGTTLVELRNGAYQTIAVDPGTHEFAVIAPFRNGRPLEDTLRVEVFEGEMLFIRHSIDFLAPSNAEAFLDRRLTPAAASEE